MSYLTQNEIAQNSAMFNRVAQAATTQNLPMVGDPPAPMNSDSWTSNHRREWAAAPDWDAAWESAKVSHPPDPEAAPGVFYDPGADESVITDGQILSQVQAMLAPPA